LFDLRRDSIYNVWEKCYTNICIMGKRVSLKDIANHVGVSVALVSYVINGQEKKKRVSASMVKKIRQAAQKLNYKPNQIARSLRTGATKTIGLIVADIANPFFSHLARIIEDEANNYNYTVLIGSCDEDKLKSEVLVNTFLNRQVDGFIIVPTEGTEKQIRDLIKEKTPIVLLDRFFPEINSSYVILDNYQATYEATSYLTDKGYKKIVLIAYKTYQIHMEERIRGYVEAVEKTGLTSYRCVKKIRFNNMEADIDKTFSELFIEPGKTDAIIFATNTLSISGLFCAQKMDILIPDNLSFIGFDGGDCFDLYPSPLSYVKQPLEEMGKEAFIVLLDLIKGSKKTSHVILNPSLIIRKSC